MRRAALAAVVLLMHAAAVSAAVRYVSDELTLPLRTGKTFQHKILRFVPSGTRVEVLTVSEADGYTQVRIPDGTEGWVKSEYLQEQPGAAERLERAEKRIAALREDGARYKEQVQGLEATNTERERHIKELELSGANLLEALAEVRRVAAEPLALAEENTRLKQTLSEQAAQLEDVRRALAEEERGSGQRWFAIGAGVTLGSLLLGIVLTRIPWRRNRWEFH